MAKHRYKKSHKRGKQSIPLAPVLPAVGLVLSAYTGAKGFNATMANNISKGMVGYDLTNGKFAVASAVPFWLSTLGGVVLHKVANKSGVNAHVRKLTMGWLSI